MCVYLSEQMECSFLCGLRRCATLDLTYLKWNQSDIRTLDVGSVHNFMLATAGMFMSRDRKNTVGTAVISGSVVLFMCDFGKRARECISFVGSFINMISVE